MSPELIAIAYRWLAIAVLGASLFGFGYVKGLGTGDLLVQAANNQSVVAELKADISGLKKAAERTHQLQEKTDVALKNSALRAQANARATDAVRAQSDGLRDQLAEADRRLADATDEAVRAYAATANAVLRDCQAKYLDMASKAAGHASDVQLFEGAWPTLPGSERLDDALSNPPKERP